jgi:hypothetical protein
MSPAQAYDSAFKLCRGEGAEVAALVAALDEQPQQVRSLRLCRTARFRVVGGGVLHDKCATLRGFPAMLGLVCFLLSLVLLALLATSCCCCCCLLRIYVQAQSVQQSGAVAAEQLPPAAAAAPQQQV